MSDSRFIVRRFADDFVPLLRQRILSGELSENMRLNEVKLAEEYGISRSPIREGLQTLAAEGYVRLVPGRGAFVTAMTPEEVSELGQIREAIESHAARIVAEAADPASLDALARSVDALESTDSGDDFHSVLLRITGNSRLEQVGISVASRLRLARSRSAARPGRPEEAAVEHRAIVDAILTGDPDAAGAAMRAHIARATESSLRVSQQNP